jgi:hypothetical protein
MKLNLFFLHLKFSDFSAGDANMVEGKNGYEPADIGTLKVLN